MNTRKYHGSIGEDSIAKRVLLTRDYTSSGADHKFRSCVVDSRFSDFTPATPYIIPSRTYRRSDAKPSNISNFGRLQPTGKVTMKRSWRGSGVGKETQLQESTSHNNMTNSPNGNGDRSREGNGDGRKNPRSLSFGASSINSSGGVASFTESAHSGLMDNAPSSSSRPRPVSRSLSGPQSPPHNPPRPSHYTMTLDQQKLAAIQEALPAVTRKVTACAACR